MMSNYLRINSQSQDEGAELELKFKIRRMNGILLYIQGSDGFTVLKINLRLILVSGKTKEFLFSPNDSAADIAKHVYDNWPMDWEEEQVSSPNILRLIYQGRFLHGNVTLGGIVLPFHLVFVNDFFENRGKFFQDRRDKEYVGRMEIEVQGKRKQDRLKWRWMDKPFITANTPRLPDGALPAAWRCPECQQGIMGNEVFIHSPAGYHGGHQRMLHGGSRTIFPTARKYNPVTWTEEMTYSRVEGNKEFSSDPEGFQSHGQ
ncbi:UBL3 protein, partial [Polypterus senegalus]